MSAPAETGDEPITFKGVPDSAYVRDWRRASLLCLLTFMTWAAFRIIYAAASLLLSDNWPATWEAGPQLIDCCVIAVFAATQALRLFRMRQSPPIEARLHPMTIQLIQRPDTWPKALPGRPQPQRVIAWDDIDEGRILADETGRVLSITVKSPYGPRVVLRDIIDIDVLAAQMRARCPSITVAKARSLHMHRETPALQMAAVVLAGTAVSCAILCCV